MRFSIKSQSVKVLLWIMYFKAMNLTRMKLYLFESLNVKIIDNITELLQNTKYLAF